MHWLLPKWDPRSGAESLGNMDFGHVAKRSLTNVLGHPICVCTMIWLSLDVHCAWRRRITWLMKHFPFDKHALAALKQHEVFVTFYTTWTLFFFPHSDLLFLLACDSWCALYMSDLYNFVFFSFFAEYWVSGLKLFHLRNLIYLVAEWRLSKNFKHSIFLEHFYH